MACLLLESRAPSINSALSNRVMNTPEILNSMSQKPSISPDLSNNSSNSSQDIENAPTKEQPWRTNNSLLECESVTSTKSSKIRQNTSLKNFDASRTPRRISSPEKRFPVKPYSPTLTPPPTQAQSIENVLRDNEGLTKVMQILERKDIDYDDDKCSDDTLADIGATFVADDNTSNIDDTICSTLSNFSAAPDLSILTKLRQNNNSKEVENGFTSPRHQTNPSTSRNSTLNFKSETPKEDDTTTMLLEFTEDLDKYSDRRMNPKYTRFSVIHNPRADDMAFKSTPMAKRHTVSNLLDFEIPPAPTPRSLPTITPRELESLKSGFLFEISSLKASLSGKEAEVSSLKSAVGDAEKRVGESLEQLREEQAQKQQLTENIANWEKRAKEMENMLLNLQEESGELVGRLAESDARRQAAELMAQEAESRMAALKTGRSSPESEMKMQVVSDTNTVDQTVENVCKDLHALYKGKHEAKIAALKKSYERRWDKRVNELENQVEELVKENKALKSDLDTKVAEAKSTLNLERTKELEIQVEELTKMHDGLISENNELRKFLEIERAEKGNLVQTVEEMIPLISSFDDILDNINRPCSASPRMHKSHHSLDQASNVEKIRGNLTKAPTIRAPMSHTSAGESRIGKYGFGLPTATRENKNRCNSSIARPNSGLEFKSGIMNSIERMGSHKGRGKC